ncbi:MAG: nuclear transport factor 2 family protein [Alphaproteobacteria bacterium]|nr:nuclear transport factor 2 family protein [Alphaproteobacteria bacterium]
MSDEIPAIEQVVQTYFDGLYDGDTRKLAAAFHDASHLYSVGPEGVQDLPRAKWFELVEGRPSGRARNLARRDRIVSIDLSGPETAYVKVECQLPPRYFTDYLLLLKTGEGWKIISKSFRAETRN